MAIIKCPECNKDVSDHAFSCPHCGYPISNGLSKNETVKVPPKPKSISWVHEWEDKARKVKITTLIIFLISLIPLVVFIGLLNTDTYYVSIVIGVIICSWIVIFAFAFWIASLICVKAKARMIDSYVVLVYNGFFTSKLVIEGRVFDSGGRHLYGELPNGKKIYAGIALWDGAIKIEER